MDIIKLYAAFCKAKGIDFQVDDKVNPYDDTTLFCPAGMQQFKSLFKDTSLPPSTCANVQSCIRMNDLDEIGDGTHLLYFNMIGLFSFRQMTIKQAIDFWVEFLELIGVKPDYVTIHPDRREWVNLVPIGYGIEFNADNIWSDGEIGGYCIEFFVDGIEIGNIVNPLGNCIDVGFGLERLQLITGTIPTPTKQQALGDAIMKIIESGYAPSNTKQGYVLRKLSRALFKSGGILFHRYFTQELERQVKIHERYERLKDKHTDKSKAWWFDTHGIDLDAL